MKLIALLVALVLERLATQLFHLRELRWLDRAFDAGLHVIARLRFLPPLIVVVLTIVLLVLPILFLRLAIENMLFGVPYLVLSIAVLFLCLGPQDVGEEVDAWTSAMRSGDDERASQLAKAMVERDITASEAVPQAVFVQGNNRMFAVIFWFIVLGPVGAWVFRVSDLFRRRAVFKAARDKSARDEAKTLSGNEAGAEDEQAPAAESASLISEQCSDATQLVHALLAWLPARLTAISYALAGHFDDAWTAFATPAGEEPRTIGAASERLLARVGMGALSAAESLPTDVQTQIETAQSARNLLYRSLIVWAVIVAALTLFGSAV